VTAPLDSARGSESSARAEKFVDGALLTTYNRAPITIVSGEGCYVTDDQGRRYLDCIAGIAVCALGHAHPVIADAVAQQARTLVHVSNLFHHEPAGTLARELVARSGLSGTFFCNSGTEANEAAIKLARKWAYRRGEPERTTILACTGSFHGRTLGALAATANDAYKEGFAPLPNGFAFTPFNDIAALESAIDDRTAAFIVEPVQGESGVHVADAAFLAAARRLCDERGALLIFDEIQCGMGRLGTLFAFQTFGIVPDVVSMAKALANGLPIGALIASKRAAQGFQPGDHGSTFGGSPVPCAAALAHLHVRDALDLDANVRARCAQLFAQLGDLVLRFPKVFDAPRGLGLLLGLPVREPYEAKAIVAEVRDRGLLLGTAGGNTIRFAPPLIVTEEQLDSAVALLADVVSESQTASA
jgi:acetylornithine/N-succinyldiaminopimelate aminotransferase